MKLGSHEYCGYLQVCVKKVLVGQIFGPFLALNTAKIGQNIGFCWFSRKVSTVFTRNLICKLIGDTFAGVLEISPRSPNFWTFWVSKWIKSNVFNHLDKSFPWIHINLSLYVHWSYFQRYVQYGHQRPNLGPILDPKASKNSGLWSLFQKVFNGFTSVLLHMLIACTFIGVWNMSLWGPILGPFGAPK